MVYLSSFYFPDDDAENSFFCGEKHTCYDSFYPFQVFTRNQLTQLDFEPITILYGGNGSGKTTALNVIAQKLGVERDTLYNRSNFFETYTELCDYRLRRRIPAHSCIITSDDVFDYMLNLRAINGGIDIQREHLFQEYQDNKYASFRMQSLADYERLKRVNTSRRTSQSRYTRKYLMDNIRERSNGENAFQYFCEKITEDGFYLLDEPENSLSPERQLELAQFLTDSVRFYRCQFIIATHSPLLLAMDRAKIYDLDENPVTVKTWTELPNVRVYYDFFKQHQQAFL